jgi:hypothetical protein
MRIGRQRRNKGRLLIQQFSLRIEYTDKRYPHTGKLARVLLR